MLKKIIQDLAKQNYLIELSSDDWLEYYAAFNNEANPWKQTTFIKALANHSGVPLPQLITAFDPLKPLTLDTLRNFYELQQNATLRITEFQQHSYIKRMNVEALALSRGQWNGIINKFERENRTNLTGSFFHRAVGSIARKNTESVKELMPSKKQPERQVKRVHDEDQQQPVKKFTRSYVKDDGINPLIYEAKDNDSSLIPKLEDKGVRVLPSSALTPVTPPRGYYGTKQTPGGHKTRPVCTIDGHTFFKPLTPNHTEKTRGRVILLDVKKEKLLKKIPKLLLDRAAPVSYTATLDTITERSGKPREQSQKSVAGVSSADVFRAYGVEIKPMHSRSQHWSHLIAHFLADPQDITPLSDEPDKEIINLVPTTSAANYNTLESVELFIRTKLIKEETDKITIKVNPIYSGERRIPDLLVYELNWSEGDSEEDRMHYNEQFFIHPQSHCRTTKTMHESIDTLRAHRTKKLFDDLENDENDENSNPNIPRSFF